MGVSMRGGLSSFHDEVNKDSLNALLCLFNRIRNKIIFKKLK
jgi:hypothetical protein